MKSPTKIKVYLLAFVLVTAIAAPIAAERFARKSIGDLRAASRRLDAELVTASRRNAIGDNLAFAFIEGRIGLAEVSRDFLALHEDDPPFHEHHRRCFPGQAPHEYAARSMANRILDRIGDPLLEQQVVDRLTEQFCALFPNAGPLQLRGGPLPVPGAPDPGTGPPRALALTVR